LSLGGQHFSWQLFLTVGHFSGISSAGEHKAKNNEHFRRCTMTVLRPLGFRLALLGLSLAVLATGIGCGRRDAGAAADG
jgi:hypothetical protein